MTRQALALVNAGEALTSTRLVVYADSMEYLRQTLFIILPDLTNKMAFPSPGPAKDQIAEICLSFVPQSRSSFRCLKTLSSFAFNSIIPIASFFSTAVPQKITFRPRRRTSGKHVINSSLSIFLALNNRKDYANYASTPLFRLKDLLHSSFPNMRAR